MEAIKVITHHPNRIYCTSVLFVLSKGLHAGKPLDKPCPNCFAIIFNSPEQYERICSLCSILWQAKIFKQHLIGSVIPFIRITDFKKIIFHYSQLSETLPANFEKIISSLKEIELEVQKNQKRNDILCMLRLSLINEFLSNI